MNAYRDKVAVITGVGSGIGRALALQLAQAGARLALSDVNAAGLKETHRLCLKAAGKEVRTYMLNVADRAAVFQHAEDVKRDFGTAHFLFNNAGVALGTSVEHTDIEQFEWLLGINLWGVIYGTKAFLPMMLAQREGYIVNLSSVLGLTSGFAQGPYSISKFGVRGFTECLWTELKGTGVQATNVHPGGIATNIASAASKQPSNADDLAKLKPVFEKLLTTPPEECARDILKGVARGKRKILTGNGARVMDWLARFFPQRYPEILHRINGM